MVDSLSEKNVPQNLIIYYHSKYIRHLLSNLVNRVYLKNLTKPILLVMVIERCMFFVNCLLTTDKKKKKFLSIVYALMVD